MSHLSGIMWTLTKEFMLCSVFGTIRDAAAMLPKVWYCQDTLTYMDCQLKGAEAVGNGCYYLEHFRQYRTCKSICDGVTLQSISERKCESFCPGYLMGNCHLSGSASTTKTTIALRTSFSTISSGELQTRMVQPATTSTSAQVEVMSPPLVIILIAICAAILLILFVVLFVVVWITAFKRRHYAGERNTIQFSRCKGGVDYSPPPDYTGRDESTPPDYQA